jgi:demethylmenaquinone methyltransferase/2-methoxy-6-polyprenyl-1,4-benzoquinol methylase
MLRRLSPNGHVVGVDVSPDMAAQFQRRCACHPNARVVRTRIEEPLPFQQEFDRAFISFVLHGLPHVERERVLDNVGQVLKPGGHFLILDYNEFSLPETPFYFKMPFKYLECSYAEDFITRDWHALLAQKGFRVVAEHVFFWGYVRLLNAHWAGDGQM